MTLNFIITEEDYLQSRLFISSKSKTVKRTRKKSWLFLTGAFFIASLVSFLPQDTFFGYYFLIITILTLLFYPQYQKRVYKRHYKKYVNENLKHHFNESATITFNADSVEMTDKTGFTQVNITEIDQITEIEKYFYLRTKSNQYLIIPKDRLNELDNVKLFFLSLAKQLNIEFISELNWKWN